MHKIIKAEQSSKHSAFEPYGFPEIDGGSLSNGIKDGEQRHSFRPTELGERETGSPAWIEDHQDNESPTDDTREEAKEMEEQAFLQGFTEGEKAGIEAEKKKIEPVLDNFRQALIEMEKIKQEVYAKAEQETVELALAVAKKIVCHEVNTNKEVILNIIKEALKRVVDTEKIKIRINRSALALLKDGKAPLSSLDDKKNITLEEDDTILTGGCVIETNFGEVDARVEKQLQVVEEAFKSELREWTQNG